MNIYADHNFLIYCIQTPSWRAAVEDAHAAGKVSVVLSPWHFYEYGNARAHADTEDLIQFAETLQPKWTMERADLQAFEFWITWEQVWNRSKEIIDPIGTLAEISGILTKVDARRTVGLTIRDFVNAFSTDAALAEVRASMSSQMLIAAFNQAAYAAGRFTKEVQHEIEVKHLALQRAKLEIGGGDVDRIFLRSEELMREQLIKTQFECFVDWGIASQLKCHKVESAFTLDLYKGSARLSENRFVDRQHASIALSYCDIFVTADGELKDRCNRAKAMVSFPTAQVVTGDEFIALLGTL